MDDELVFLGSGGGRHHLRTQHRATGGILFKFNETQAHIDPGPGAIVRINQYGEDPTKTELFIVTHIHIDHFNDISVMIESSRNNFYDEDRNLITDIVSVNYKTNTTYLNPEDIVPIVSPTLDTMDDWDVFATVASPVPYVSPAVYSTSLGEDLDITTFYGGDDLYFYNLPSAEPAETGRVWISSGVGDTSGTIKIKL